MSRFFGSQEASFQCPKHPLWRSERSLIYWYYWPWLRYQMRTPARPTNRLCHGLDTFWPHARQIQHRPIMSPAWTSKAIESYQPTSMAEPPWIYAILLQIPLCRSAMVAIGHRSWSGAYRCPRLRRLVRGLSNAANLPLQRNRINLTSRRAAGTVSPCVHGCWRG